jgi:glycosyltransferase involved in cell wall biosynthesis
MDRMAIFNSDCPQASIIVTCKGRLHHLRRTLPCMLAQDCAIAFEVVVVDFGCPRGTFDRCAALDVRNLVVMKVLDDTADFHLSRARNCGASVARGPILAFVDADVFLDSAWLKSVTQAIRDGHAGLCTVAGGFQRDWGRWGTCAVAAEIFHAVRGYDKAVRGWGGEDIDLYSRAQARAARVRYAGFLVTPIGHGDEERVRFQARRTIESSNLSNMTYLSHRQGLINPAGYGQGEFTIFRGRGAALPPVRWLKRQRVVQPLRRQTFVERNSCRFPQETT